MFSILKQIFLVRDADWSIHRSRCAKIHNIITARVCQSRDTVSAPSPFSCYQTRNLIPPGRKDLTSSLLTR